MNDPYMGEAKCGERLRREYERYNRLIIALDFDDTVFDFHRSGHTYERVLSVVRRAQRKGFYIVLFTGSRKAEWNRQCSYLADHGITVDCINRTPVSLPFGNDGKPYYNLLLDDRAGLGQAVRALEALMDEIEERYENENLSRHSA